MINVRQGSIEEIVKLGNQIPEFRNPHQKKEYEHRLQTKHLILIAEANQKPVGFKCGYEREPSSGKFYSWMGGVLPDYRHLGAAKLLLEEMEEWCRREGYHALEFKTLNEHKSMLIFSIKYGFEIIAVIDSPKDKRKRIVLQKPLTQ